MALIDKKCLPCRGGTPPLTSAAMINYQRQIAEAWLVIGDKTSTSPRPKKIRRRFTFKNFQAAMKFVNAVAERAILEDHHPDIHIAWNKVTLELWTHAIGGLSESDFILAAKIDVLPEARLQIYASPPPEAAVN